MMISDILWLDVLVPDELNERLLPEEPVASEDQQEVEPS